MIRRPGFRAMLLWVALIGVHPAVASADDALDSNRPNVTESARVLPSCYLQLESGWTREAADGTTVNALGEALLRRGWGEATELRVFAPTCCRVGAGNANAANDWTPCALGVKRRLTAEDTAWSSALVGAFGLPGGTGAFRRRVAAESALLVVGHNFGRIETDANAGAALSGGTGAQRWSETAAIAELFPVRKGVNAYVEWYATFANGHPPAHAADGGLTVSVRADFQLDVRYGGSLANGTNDRYLGAGFAKRWGSRAAASPRRRDP